MSYLPTILAALVAAVSGLLFALSFVAWVMCEPDARRGRYAPKPLPALLAFILFCSLAYLLAP